MFEIVPNWHPIVVHFTVALLVLSVVVHITTRLLPAGPLLAEAKVFARWSLWLGVTFAIATVATGWLAYNSVTHDDVSHAAMLVHRNWALATLLAFLVAGVWSLWRYRGERLPGGVFLLALLTAGGLLLGTAWRGGELVFRHGLGVMALPQQPEPPQQMPVVPQSTAPQGGHDHASHTH
jgi:uncharacterized membrane protein